MTSEVIVSGGSALGIDLATQLALAGARVVLIDRGDELLAARRAREAQLDGLSFDVRDCDLPNMLAGVGEPELLIDAARDDAASAALAARIGAELTPGAIAAHAGAGHGASACERYPTAWRDRFGVFEVKGSAGPEQIVEIAPGAYTTPVALHRLVLRVGELLGKPVRLKTAQAPAPSGEPRQTEAAPSQGATLFQNRSARVWEVADDMIAICLATPGNSINPEAVDSLSRALEAAEERASALLIVNEGSDFSLGANLALVVAWTQSGQWERIRNLVRNIQELTYAMTYASVPVVTVAFGRVLGGGLELCLASAGVLARPGVSAGLVEVQLGLLPGGGGTAWMLRHEQAQAPFARAQQGSEQESLRVFDRIFHARVADGASCARRSGYLPRATAIIGDGENGLASAVRWVRGLRARSARTRPSPTLRVSGAQLSACVEEFVAQRLAAGEITEHDALIASKIAWVLSGGGTTADSVYARTLLELEQEAFLSLAGEPKSQARMQHMLATHTRLRN